MTQDVEDASPSPAPSGDHTSAEKNEVKMEGEQSEDRSPENSKDGSEPNAKGNAKDPSRPRRKKARRACFACQRAHLTCGDERPCLRCIKRGLQDHCHDGVRKKAKYLHDAPAEALMPGMGGSYQPTNGTNQRVSSITSATPSVNTGPSVAYTSAPNAQLPYTDFDGFGSSGADGQAQSPSNQDTSILEPFLSPQNPLPSTTFVSRGNQQMNQMQAPPQVMDQAVQQPQQQNQQFATPFIDPTDPAFFNFDISGLNFGNHYGALEFGMLGHMSSGAGETPEDSSLINNINQGTVSFDNSGAPANTYSTAGPNFSYPSSDEVFADWRESANAGSRQGSTSQLYTPATHGSNGNTRYDAQNNFPSAFAIGEGNGSISSTSPGTNSGLDFVSGYNTSPASATNLFNHRTSQQHDIARQQIQQQRQPHQQQQQHQQHQNHPHHNQHQPQSRNIIPTLTDNQGLDINRKRKRDSSHIYSSVQAPYSYTTGFHSLTAFLQKRFSPQKTVRIAKALASIRPSFISCTKELNRDDLIFMEKCFQRTLLQYEDFIGAYGTPTVICRRTGEVAAVSKEFSLLTGWRRDLLLGKEPNLNVNTGGTSGIQTGTSSRGAATPRVGNGGIETTGSWPQPVFLAELLDDDSVINFYEDFAKLAFGDSRGYVVRPCKLLKYKTKDDPGWGPDSSIANNESARTNAATGMESKGIIGANSLFSGEAGMNVLGARDGKVDCMYCWTVKRDVFDIPMLIVMNFLPVI